MKMLSIIKLIVAVLFVVGLNSCMSEQKKLDVQKIDNLITILDSASYYSVVVDSIEVNKAYQDYQIHLKDMETYLIDKPKSKADIELIGNYGLIRKPLRDYGKNRKSLIKKVDEQRQQLAMLKEDRLKNRVGETEFVEYYAQEEALANQTKTEAFNLYQTTELYLNQYYKLNDRLVVLMDSVISAQKK